MPPCGTQDMPLHRQQFRAPVGRLQQILIHALEGLLHRFIVAASHDRYNRVDRRLRCHLLHIFFNGAVP